MEFTNTFEGGMHKDSNVLLQPHGTFRDMQNGMLVSSDGNHYVVELPKGTQVSFTIPPRYNSVYTSLDSIPTPIGFISFLDTLVVFSTNKGDVNDDTGGYGEIGIVTFGDQLGLSGVGTYIPIYNHESLNFSIAHQISGFTFEENDGIKRVYWTDNYNEPRVLNVDDPMLSHVVSGNIAEGIVYMVTRGTIAYDDGTGLKNYGPGLSDGNIFIGFLGNTTFTVIDGFPIVTQYIDYHLLSWTPDRVLPSIDFNKWVSGSLYGGSKSYFVRYGKKSQGYYTSWSYGSFPINIYNIGAYSGNAVHVEGTGASGVLANSNTGIELSISGIDTNYDLIEVASAEFDQQNNVLRSAIIFASLPITGETMTIQHLTETGTELTVNDLTIFPANILKVKDITTSKNYNVIGNIGEREELSDDFDPSSATISDLTYTLPFDDTSVSTYPYNDVNIAVPAAGVTSIVAEGKYVVSGGVIQYGANQYGPGTANGIYFTGIAGGPSFTSVSGTPVVNGCILIKKYRSQAGLDRYRHVVLKDDFWDYHGMATTQYLRQYWGNETYRFGILTYDKKGNPYYVRWIGDHQTQTYTAKGGPVKITYGRMSLQINGKTISGLSIPATDMANISGFSIVRAPRDKQYYAQGLLWPTVKDNANIRPLSLAKTDDDFNYNGFGANGKINCWYSPDALFGFSGLIPSAGDYLEGEFFTDAFGAGYINDGATNQIFTKFYQNGGTKLQTLKIEQYDEVNAGNGISSYISGYDFANSFLKTTSASYIGERNAKGGRLSLVTLDDEPVFPNGYDMVDPSINARYAFAKPLMNYKKPKSNLYGGTTKSALANTIYISTGHYQSITNDVLTDTYDLGTDSYIFDEIEVWGGDSFLTAPDLVHGMYDNVSYTDTYSFAIFFPVESNINPGLRQGRFYSKYGGYTVPEGVVYDNSGTSKPEEYGMNDSYASDASIIAYPALPDVVFHNDFPYRVRWAGAKSIGELVDSFRVFLQNNYRDLDGNKGQINNVRSRDGKVFYWQDHAIGYLPILERVTIAGSSGEATQLGVGGVIDRFDTFNTYFGNQHKFGLIESEYGFSWFDFRRKAFLIMSVGGGIQEISFIKGMQTFFNSQFSSIIPISDTPLLGTGISGVYDPEYKMTYMSFKWQTTIDGKNYINHEFTIGYHHPRSIFVGFFDLKAAIWHSHNQYLIGAKNNIASSITGNTYYPTGSTITKDGIEYLCTAAFTTHNTVQAYEQPNYVGSVYWLKTSSINEVNWLFSTNEYIKFFGYAYDHSITLIVNPKTGSPFCVDNFRQKSNSLNYDTVYVEVSDDSAIESTNSRHYRYIDKSWNSSVPIGANGRLIDFYLNVKLSYKNYVNNQGNSRNLQKVFEFITSVLRIKK